MDDKSGSIKRNLAAGLSSYIDDRREERLGQTPRLRGEDYHALSDAELIDLIVRRDRDALEVVYSRYSGPVYSLAMHILRDAGAAEEAVQDAFFNLWRRASSYRSNRGKVAAWLFSIAHHRVIDELRRRQRRERVQVIQDVEPSLQPDKNSPDPTKYAHQQMQRAKIKEALTALPREQRDVVVLAYFGGLTHTEIAKRLEQPLGTVKTRMRLALRKLRIVIGPQGREWVEHGL